MAQRAAIFCHNGLGDGVNSLVLSNNLQLNGWKVDTYQNAIGSMKNWFPHLEVHPYPNLDEQPRLLQSYDWFFVVHNDTDLVVLTLIREGKRRFPLLDQCEHKKVCIIVNHKKPVVALQKPRLLIEIWIGMHLKVGKPIFH